MSYLKAGGLILAILLIIAWTLARNTPRSRELRDISRRVRAQHKRRDAAKQARPL